jgi:hypothetical protein
MLYSSSIYEKLAPSVEDILHPLSGSLKSSSYASCREAESIVGRGVAVAGGVVVVVVDVVVVDVVVVDVVVVDVVVVDVVVVVVDVLVVVVEVVGLVAVADVLEVVGLMAVVDVTEVVSCVRLKLEKSHPFTTKIHSIKQAPRIVAPNLLIFTVLIPPLFGSY